MVETSKRIICVDDNADVLKAIQRILMDEHVGGV
jgi:CheY-like chemotaxis protein